MITLGIETSCDETSVALLETRGEYPKTEYRVLSHLVHSQIAVHAKFGGVFPMMAKREHKKRLVPLLEKAIEESGLPTEPFTASAETLENIRKICGEYDMELYEAIERSYISKSKPAIDRIAVTEGPGLEPALWVGINLAEALAALWEVPVEGVNHMEGHIAASLLPSAEPRQGFQRLLDCPFPTIALLLSGGHTEIVLVKKIGDYKILGSTRDDAVGEAFDKVARMLGLPYPGGPEISRLAEEERENAVPRRGSDGSQADFAISLPRPMIDSPSLDMSFSGLKTAVLYELKKHRGVDASLQKEMAREFEDAVTETIITKLEKAFGENEARCLLSGGGVMANRHIREACAELAERHGIPFFPPASGLSGDNALMIAAASAIHNSPPAIKGRPLSAKGGLSIG